MNVIPTWPSLRAPASPLDCAPPGGVCPLEDPYHPRRQPLTGYQGALRGLALAVVAALALPVLYLVIRAVGAGEAAITYLLSPRTGQVILNSLALTAAVVASSVLIGVPFAWLTTRTDLPFRRFWLVAGLLTLVIPSYIGAMTYIAAFGPRGLLQQMLAPLGISALPPIYGFFGAWLSVTLFTYPYVVMPVRAALLNTDPALEESARSMGLGRWAVFWRVTLPQLRPALATGMILSGLYTLSDFGAVALMRFDAFTRVIYLQFTSSFDRSLAAVLSLALVALTVILIAAERRVAASSHTRRNYRVGVGASRRPRTVRLGRWRWPVLIFCGALVGIGVIVPVAVLSMWAIQGAGSGLPAASLAEPAVNTVLASALAALVVGAIAIPLAILGARASGRFGRWLVQMAYLGNGLPGVVIALALVFFAANAVPGLYQTLPVLIFGFAVRFLPLSIGATRSALTQIDPRLEEAGRSLGLPSWRAALRITVPLARAGALGGVALVFLNAAKELPTTLLLSPTGFRTLTTQIWTAQIEARFTQAAPPALLIIVLSALSLYFILKDRAHIQR
jgi:iron(III) transport system permease protein